MIFHQKRKYYSWITSAGGGGSELVNARGRTKTTTTTESDDDNDNSRGWGGIWESIKHNYTH